MATTDNNMLMLVLIGLGLIGFAASGSPGEEEEVNRMGAVDDLAVDQYIPYSPHGNSKQADLGEFNARGRQIIEYITQQAGILIGYQRRFDQGMSGGKDVTWLQENAQDELAILRSYIVICKERDTEFKSLWEELRRMTGGNNEWMRNNSDLRDLPGQIADKLQRYYNVSPDSIMKYQAQLQEQMGRERMQLNQVLQQKLEQFQSETFRSAQGQVEYFMNFAQQQALRNQEQAGQIERLENQMNQMEVDADTGSALLQDPFSHQTIVHNTVNKFQYNDLGGNTMTHQVSNQLNLPQSMASRNVPEDPYYNDPNTGQGWAMEGASSRDRYGLSRPQQAITYGADEDIEEAWKQHVSGPTDEDVQEAYERHVGGGGGGRSYAATNENGRRAVTNEEARGTYDTHEVADMGAGFTPNNRIAQATYTDESTVSRVNRSVSQIRQQQSRVQAPSTNYNKAQATIDTTGVPTDPFQVGGFSKSIPSEDEQKQQEKLVKERFRIAQTAANPDTSTDLVVYGADDGVATSTDLVNVLDYTADEVLTIEQNPLPANTTQNLKQNPRQSWTAIQQTVTSPRSAKRGRRSSISQAPPGFKVSKTETAAELRDAPGEVQVEKGIAELPGLREQDSKAITYGTGITREEALSVLGGGD